MNPTNAPKLVTQQIGDESDKDDVGNCDCMAETIKREYKGITDEMDWTIRTSILFTFPVGCMGENIVIYHLIWPSYWF